MTGHLVVKFGKYFIIKIMAIACNTLNLKIYNLVGIFTFTQKRQFVGEVDF